MVGRIEGLKSNAFTPYEASGASKISKHHAKLESYDPLFSNSARIDGHGHNFTSARITVPYRGASKSYRFVSSCRASRPVEPAKRYPTRRVLQDRQPQVHAGDQSNVPR